MAKKQNKKYKIRTFEEFATVVTAENADMLCGNFYGIILQFIEMRKIAPELKFLGFDWIDDGKLEIRNPNTVLNVQEK